MFCNQCGSELSDGAMFCPKCGSKQELKQDVIDEAVKDIPKMDEPEKVNQPNKVEVPVAGVAGPIPEEKSNKKDKKKSPIKILIPVAILCVVVIGIVVLMNSGIFSSKGFGTISDDYVYANYTNDVCYFGNNKGEVYVCDDDMSVERYNANREIALYYVYDGDGLSSLYYIDSSLEPVLVTDEAYTFSISYTGEYIYYTQDVEDYSGTLYLYCVKNGKVTQIDKDVYCDYICLSPSGETVSYLKDYEAYDENTLYIGGVNIKSKEVDDDGCVPVAISDNGKKLFYFNEDRKLYYYNGKESEKICSDVETSVYFNEDLTEMIFGKDDKTYYYTLKMDEPLKIAGDYMYGIATEGNTAIYRDNYSYIYDTNTLKGCLLRLSGGLYWLNEKGTELVKIVSLDTVGDYQISLNYDSMLYTKNGDLYIIEKFDKNMESKVLFDEEYVSSIVANNDLSRIYVVSEDELYYIKGEDKSERISNDLNGIYSVVYNNNLNKICYIENDTLMQADKTEKSAKEIAEDAVSLYTIGNDVIYTVDDDDEDIWYFMKGKEPVKLDID